MQPIVSEVAAAALRRYAGRRVYVHVEFVRGGFVRNLAAHVEEAVIRGEGPYRVALRCQEAGWVVIEGLTHMEAPGPGPLFLCALESDQRLAQALQISPEPFAP